MKYYYTDPLEAAYMAKHCGMKFWDNPDSKAFCNDVATIMDASWDKFYIHPDSLKVLEPQIGDLCEKEKASYSCNYCGMDRFFDLEGFESEQLLELYPNSKVIQRNDKPFFWPLIEQ